MELLSKLGIDWKLLLAQIVNFLILLFILYRFAYKPVLKMLDDRSSKIEKGLKDAEDSQKKLQEITLKEREIIKDARVEALAILAKVEEQARKNKEEIIAEAKSSSEKVLKDAEKKIKEEKNKMVSEVKGEIAGLVVMATKKVISEKLDRGKDIELIKKAIQ